MAGEEHFHCCLWMLSSEQQVMGEEKQRQGAERMKAADKNLPDQRDASWKEQFISLI